MSFYGTRQAVIVEVEDGGPLLTYEADADTRRGDRVSIELGNYPPRQTTGKVVGIVAHDVGRCEACNQRIVRLNDGRVVAPYDGPLKYAHLMRPATPRAREMSRDEWRRWFGCRGTTVKGDPCRADALFVPDRQFRRFPLPELRCTAHREASA